MPREDGPPEGNSLTKPPARYYTSVSACSCGDWTWRGSRPGKYKGRPCKHMVSLQRAVAVIAENAVMWATAER